MRILASIVLMTVLFALIRNLYRAMYHEPRSEAISRDLNFFYNDNENGNGAATREKDQIARRDRILRLRERMGVNLDSLPTIRFASSSFPSSFSSSSSSSSRRRRIRKKKKEKKKSSINNNEERAMRERQRECLTHGAFVSATDEFVDCRAYCNASDGVEYRYYDRLGVLLNGRIGRVGGYCMPTDAAVCNTKTSLAVYGRDGNWRCMSQIRAFAGEDGNMIVACDGQLFDRATGRVWREHIDSSLAFDSIDEFLPGAATATATAAADDKNNNNNNNDNDNDIASPDMYRFVCPPSRDERDNWRIESPFDRLVLLNNTCASLIPHADDSIRPNFAKGLCECGSRARYSSTLATCVPLDAAVFDDVEDHDDDDDDDDDDDENVSGELFSSKTLETVIIDRSGPCWEPWMTLSQGRELSNAAMTANRMTVASGGSGSGAMALCGIENFSAGSGAANPAFDRTRALVFDRIVPSPAAMLLSSPSLTTGGGGIATMTLKRRRRRSRRKEDRKKKLSSK